MRFAVWMHVKSLAAGPTVGNLHGGPRLRQCPDRKESPGRRITRAAHNFLIWRSIEKAVLCRRDHLGKKKATPPEETCHFSAGTREGADVHPQDFRIHWRHRRARCPSDEKGGIQFIERAIQKKAFGSLGVFQARFSRHLPWTMVRNVPRSVGILSCVNAQDFPIRTPRTVRAFLPFGFGFLSAGYHPAPISTLPILGS